MVVGVEKRFLENKSNATKPTRVKNVQRGRKKPRKPKTEDSIIGDERNLYILKRKLSNQ